MPNHCWNNVIITGTKERIAQLHHAATETNDFFRYGVKDIGEWDYGAYVETYGTKWAPYDMDVVLEDENTLCISMSTAWAPPIEAYNLLMEDDAIDSVYATFIEPGMDFAGIYENGDVEEETLTVIADTIINDGSAERLTGTQLRIYEEFEGDIESIIEWRQEEEEDDE